MHVRVRTVLLLTALLSTLPAQPQPLAPTSNLTITTGGTLHYSSILIPAGVTVQFTGTAPAVVQCDGDCIVNGTLSAAAIGATDGPGAVSIGTGSTGSNCWGFCTGFGCTCSINVPAGPGVHHGVYGSALPFSLLGGSPGGSLTLYSSSTPLSCCNVFNGVVPGRGGGGTLVVHAGGTIDISGAVDVRGGVDGLGSAHGSAGSLLLRGQAGTLIRPGAQLLAGPASASGGEVRLDSWATLPVVQGTIDAPAPFVVTLPHLHASNLPITGTTWLLDVFAPANTIVFLAGSTQRGASTPTPFGTLELDLSATVILGTTAAVAGHDPRATIGWAVPNMPQIIGLGVWLQGLAAPPSLAPRLTNTISAIVQ